MRNPVRFSTDTIHFGFDFWLYIPFGGFSLPPRLATFTVRGVFLLIRSHTVHGHRM